MTEDQVSRNQPCPCGSGKKYKRCCGKGAAPQLGTPKQAPPQLPEGMDPNAIQQFQNMMKRMPKGQLAHLQSLAKRAMAGQDVSQEMAKLGPQFGGGAMAQMEEAMKGMDEEQMAKAAQQMGFAPPADSNDAETEMTPEKAQDLVRAAVESG